MEADASAYADASMEALVAELERDRSAIESSFDTKKLEAFPFLQGAMRLEAKLPEAKPAVEFLASLGVSHNEVAGALVRSMVSLVEADIDQMGVTQLLGMVERSQPLLAVPLLRSIPVKAISLLARNREQGVPEAILLRLTRDAPELIRDLPLEIQRQAWHQSPALFAASLQPALDAYAAAWAALPAAATAWDAELRFTSLERRGVSSGGGASSAHAQTLRDLKGAFAGVVGAVGGDGALALGAVQAAVARFQEGGEGCFATLLLDMLTAFRQRDWRLTKVSALFDLSRALLPLSDGGAADEAQLAAVRAALHGCTSAPALRREWAAAEARSKQRGTGLRSLSEVGGRGKAAVPRAVRSALQSKKRPKREGPEDRRGLAEEALRAMAPARRRDLLYAAWESVAEKDPGGFFARPVTDEIAPGYSRVISRPMDMSRIRAKLADYAGVADFTADVLLMCDNCMAYNDAKTVYHRKAKTIRNWWFRTGEAELVDDVLDAAPRGAGAAGPRKRPRGASAADFKTAEERQREEQALDREAASRSQAQAMRRLREKLEGREPAAAPAAPAEAAGAAGGEASGAPAGSLAPLAGRAALLDEADGGGEALRTVLGAAIALLAEPSVRRALGRFLAARLMACFDARAVPSADEALCLAAQLLGLGASAPWILRHPRLPLPSAPRELLRGHAPALLAALLRADEARLQAGRAEEAGDAGPAGTAVSAEDAAAALRAAAEAMARGGGGARDALHEFLLAACGARREDPELGDEALLALLESAAGGVAALEAAPAAEAAEAAEGGAQQRRKKRLKLTARGKEGGLSAAQRQSLKIRVKTQAAEPQVPSPPELHLLASERRCLKEAGRAALRQLLRRSADGKEAGKALLAKGGTALFHRCLAEHFERFAAAAKASAERGEGPEAALGTAEHAAYVDLAISGIEVGAARKAVHVEERLLAQLDEVLEAIGGAKDKPSLAMVYGEDAFAAVRAAYERLFAVAPSWRQSMLG